MVRGVTILLFLTVFIQAGMGSMFDQFHTTEKRDKNKMLMYLRGLLKLDTPERSKGHINKRGIVSVPPTHKTEYQPVYDSKKLPDRSDKSKMLSYLRGLKTPNSVFSVYEEPKHQINENMQDIQTNLITQNANARMSHNTLDKQSVVINSQPSDAQSANQAANWDGATATQMTFLQPAEHERDSDTCFWRGQHTHPVERAQEKDNMAGRKGLEGGRVEAYVDFENVGENLISFWECFQTKFYKSYERLKAKICSILYNDDGTKVTTPNPSTTKTTTPSKKG